MGLFDFLKKKKNNEFENTEENARAVEAEKSLDEQNEEVSEKALTEEVKEEVKEEIIEIEEENVENIVAETVDKVIEKLHDERVDKELQKIIDDKIEETYDRIYDETAIKVKSGELINYEKINAEKSIGEAAENEEAVTEANTDENDQNEEAAEETKADENAKAKEEQSKADETTESEEPSEKKQGFFAKIKAGLSKTRNNIMSGVDNVLKSFVKIDEELFEELEEALIMADIGVETSLYIIEKLRERVKDERATEASQVKGLLVKVISEILEKDDEPLNLTSPSVILVIGVNGVGKTTTIGKLAHNYKSEGKSVLLAAADTFRAAAIDQLQIWGDRNDCEVIKHQENSDPAAVVFDAVNAAKARKTDVLICDTAGRLHNKKNLMEELRKISRVIDREYPEAHIEVFLVLDATTGQNALQQAKLFKEVADITGLVLTKLDGTAKGGIVIAIKHDMNIPVRYIGVGEQINDLQPFDSKEFAKALFDEE
ncbi:MAG: signal recognition particle-docking protein FtsY [Clostridia bacterium]|nr:signal recognition particle-docking protein FtsY [Clostridia bacterium]